MARDYATEITAANAAGDVAALARLAFLLLAKVDADDERRARQADKKRRQRDKEGQPRRPQLSQDVPGQAGTGFDASLTTRSTTTAPPPIAREPLSRDALDFLERDVCAQQLRPRMADLWPSVLRFLGRRPVGTWGGWTREMLKLVAGEEFTTADMAQVCDDDEALTRPIGSPFVLRRFLVTMRAARIEEPATPTGKNGNGHSTRRAAQGGARNDAAIASWLEKREAAKAEAVHNGQ